MKSCDLFPSCCLQKRINTWPSSFSFWRLPKNVPLEFSLPSLSFHIPPPPLLLSPNAASLYLLFLGAVQKVLSSCAMISFFVTGPSSSGRGMLQSEKKKDCARRHQGMDFLLERFFAHHRNLMALKWQNISAGEHIVSCRKSGAGTPA